LLPEPVRQFPVVHNEVLVATTDFGFPPVPFVAEVDGLATHATQQALAYDLNRQNRIEDAEYGLRRFTALDVYLRPRYVRRETVTGLGLASLIWGRRLAA
jgi:very-short-patch-repair endonuclease